MIFNLEGLQRADLAVLVSAHVAVPMRSRRWRAGRVPAGLPLTLAVWLPAPAAGCCRGRFASNAGVPSACHLAGPKPFELTWFEYLRAQRESSLEALPALTCRLQRDVDKWTFSLERGSDRYNNLNDTRAVSEEPKVGRSARSWNTNLWSKTMRARPLRR